MLCMSYASMIILQLLLWVALLSSAMAVLDAEFSIDTVLTPTWSASASKMCNRVSLNAYKNTFK
jgi:hypothetical protein